MSQDLTSQFKMGMSTVEAAEKTEYTVKDRLLQIFKNGGLYS